MVTTDDWTGLARQVGHLAAQLGNILSCLLEGEDVLSPTIDELAQLFFVTTSPIPDVQATVIDTTAQSLVCIVTLHIILSEEDSSWEQLFLSPAPPFTVVFPFLSKCKPFLTSPTVQEQFHELETLVRSSPLPDSRTSEGLVQVLHFYEHFFAGFHQRQRRSQGVYYTPSEVVRFLVLSAELIGRKHFGWSGLGDSRVRLLDFSTGSGIFLHGVFEALLTNQPPPPLSLLQSQVYGFELQFTSWLVAQIVLCHYLGQIYGSDFPIDLPGLVQTNSLDHGYLHDSHGHPVSINVVIGNPPYSNYPSNEEVWVDQFLHTYKEGLTERKFNLRDDYIRFFRYAQLLVEQTGYGVVAVVTNNSFLDSPTRRGMRKSLLETFDEIFIVNLHGNRLRRETDDNIFGIQQGVCLTILVKNCVPSPTPTVHYTSSSSFELVTKEQKLSWLAGSDLCSVNWTIVRPCQPYYWFLPKDPSFQSLLDHSVSVTEIFRLWKSGVGSDRDRLFLDRDCEILQSRMMNLFGGQYDDEFAKIYRVQNSSSYKLLGRLSNHSFSPSNLYLTQRRPLDYMWMYYHPHLTSRASYDVMQHLIRDKDNLGLVFTRQSSGGWSHVFVTQGLTDRLVVSNETRQGAYVAPLYLIPVLDQKKSPKRPHLAKFLGVNGMTGSSLPDRSANLTDHFRTQLSSLFKGLRSPSPEEVFGYVYGVLNSNLYRNEFLGLLEVDFPRVPMPPTPILFNQISQLGFSLALLHLLRSTVKDPKRVFFPVEGSNVVEKIAFDKNKVFINPSQYFSPVSLQEWSWIVGSYPVLHTWLRERRGSFLTPFDIQKFVILVQISAETLITQEKLDEAFQKIILYR